MQVTLQPGQKVYLEEQINTLIEDRRNLITVIKKLMVLQQGFGGEMPDIPTIIKGLQGMQADPEFKAASDYVQKIV